MNHFYTSKITFPVNSDNTAKWIKTESWGLPPPECIVAPKSRDNHNGNGVGGFPNMYNWTIPDLPHKHCVLRMRYNISTADIKMEADSSLNGSKEITLF